MLSTAGFFSTFRSYDQDRHHPRFCHCQQFTATRPTNPSTTMLIYECFQTIPFNSRFLSCNSPMLVYYRAERENRLKLLLTWRFSKSQALLEASYGNMQLCEYLSESYFSFFLSKWVHEDKSLLKSRKVEGSVSLSAGIALGCKSRIYSFQATCVCGKSLQWLFANLWTTRLL